MVPRIPETFESLFAGKSLTIRLRGCHGCCYALLRFGRSEAEDVERTRKQVFEDEFASFPKCGARRQRQWMHAPGYRCTDAATLPEPYWHESWQVVDRERITIMALWFTRDSAHDEDKKLIDQLMNIMSFLSKEQDKLSVSQVQQLRGENAGIPPQPSQKCRVDEGEQMWSAWHLMENFLTDQSTTAEVEMMQLQTEERKAKLGG